MKSNFDIDENGYFRFIDRRKERVYNKLLNLIEDQEELEFWLDTPNIAFEWDKPRNMLETWEGLDRLERLIYYVQSGEPL